jgi:hypothetical protein
VGSGATVHLIGTVTMQQDPALALDDVSIAGAGAPALVADPAAQLVAPSNVTAVAGVFHWCAGKVDSSLKIGANVKTEIGVGAATNTCQANSTATVNLGAGADAANRHVLQTDGPASVNNATVFLEDHTGLTFNGTTTLGGGTVFDHTGATVDDENLVFGSSAKVSMPSLSLPSLFTTTHPTINVPGTNAGTLTADSALALHALWTNAGAMSVAATVTATAPIVNTGTMTMFQSTLNARAGYTQRLAGATAATPVTQLNDAQASLSTSDGASPPVLGPVVITNGGLVGGGTVVASSVNIGSGFLRPSPFNNGALTTLTIQAPLTLSSSSDVQFILNASGHDLLKVSGSVAFAGKVTGFTGSGYVPAYLTLVRGVMTFPSHTGDFATSSWAGTPAGLGWKPRPLTSSSKQLDLQLVDTAPPSLGIASIPAFTEFNSQRVTYAAVDNKTGVKSYDVRWSSGSSLKAYSSWHYPAGWQRTTATFETLPSLVDGYSYCFSIRARDNAGNITPWSVPLCTAKMYDDAALNASAGWKRLTKKVGFYKQTYTQSFAYARTLARFGTYTRIGVIAFRCPTCGVINIYSGSKLIKQLSLRSTKAKSGLFAYVTGLMPQHTGRVTIKIVSRKRNVVIDAFGLKR